MVEGRLVEVADTKLFVEERGAPEGFPVMVLHGGPGLDHHMFGEYLDPLTAHGRCRLILIDERAQGRSDRSAAPGTRGRSNGWRPMSVTWRGPSSCPPTRCLAIRLGRSSLCNSGRLPWRRQGDGHFGGSCLRPLAGVCEDELATFEPIELREQVASSWAREATAQTEDETSKILIDQWPFHFWVPQDPRIDDYRRRTAEARYAPDVLRQFATSHYGGIEVEDRLPTVSQPVLVLWVVTIAPVVSKPVTTWPTNPRCRIRRSRGFSPYVLRRGAGPLRDSRGRLHSEVWLRSIRI